MHCSKKLLGSGDEAYFNEKGPVNMRVDGTAHFAESLPGGAIPKPLATMQHRSAPSGGPRRKFL